MDEGAHVVMENSAFRVVLKKKNNILAVFTESKTKDAMGDVAWVEDDSISTSNKKDKLYILAMESLFDKVTQLEKTLKRIAKNDYSFG